MRTDACVRCGATPLPPRARKYCGPECQHEDKRERLGRGERNRTFRKVESVCEQCGKTFESGMSNARFCGRTCQVKQYRLDSGLIQPEPPDRACRTCGTSLVGTFRNKIHCSGRCESWARRNPGVPWVPAKPVCEFCGVGLGSGRRSGTRYCSLRCSERFRFGVQIGHIVACKQCGQDFVATAKTNVLCSSPCRRAEKHGNNLRRLSVIQRGYRDGETFTRLDVFERDGWMCYLCSEPVEPLLRYPDPWSASVDHVVALSRGGQHTLDNVACTHFRCNLQKLTKSIGRLTEETDEHARTSA